MTRFRPISLISIVSILAVSLALSANAYIVDGSMGRDDDSSSGQCLAVAKPSFDEAAQLLIAQNIRLSSNAAADEIVALGWGIKQILSLAPNGKFAGIVGSRFHYSESDGVWNQSSGPIKVNRAWGTWAGMNSRNIAMLIHELGHYVGNNTSSANLTSYERYYSAVPGACHFSWYSHSSRREEFAEVFSAFVVHPQLLLKAGDANCVRAYHFLRQRVFPEGKLARCDGEKPEVRRPKLKPSPTPVQGTQPDHQPSPQTSPAPTPSATPQPTPRPTPVPQAIPQPTPQATPKPVVKPKPLATPTPKPKHPLDHSWDWLKDL